MSWLGLAPIVALVIALAPGPDDGSSDPGEPTACEGHAHLHTAADYRAWTQGLYRWNYRFPKWAQRKHRHALACAASPQDRAKIVARRRHLAKTLMPRRFWTFIRIGRCERPSSSGFMGIEWTNPGPQYVGGLGFAASTWAGWRKKEPAQAHRATWRQQIAVANRVADDVGLTAWGCY